MPNVSVLNVWILFSDQSLYYNLQIWLNLKTIKTKQMF